MAWTAGVAAGVGAGFLVGLTLLKQGFAHEAAPHDVVASVSI